jgi:hypothetical protein
VTVERLGQPAFHLTANLTLVEHAPEIEQPVLDRRRRQRQTIAQLGDPTVDRTLD